MSVSFKLMLIGHIALALCLVQGFEHLDGFGLFAIGTAKLKPQHLQTMTLLTQHKPIERSADMAFMTKQDAAHEPECSHVC